MQEDRVEIPPDALVRTTGQLWKLVVAGLVLPLPTALFALWLINRIDPRQSTVEVVVGGIALVTAAGIIAFLLWSIKCPGCSVRWVGRVFTEQGSTAALTRFLKMRACPKCGFGGE